MQMKVFARKLKNEETSNSTTPEKMLQIIVQNQSHTSIVMSCDSSIVNELLN
jgi:hypothetical protein